MRVLSPDLRSFFRNLDPLIKASRTGLPAGSEVIRGLKPTLAELTPFLQQVNPILQYLEASQFQVSDFITNGAAALSDTEPSTSGGVGHYLRQLGPVGAESLAIYPKRPNTNRGNSYLPPLGLFGDLKGTGIFPNYDCKPSGGEVAPTEGNPGCRVADKQDFGQGLQGSFPHVKAADYGSRQVARAQAACALRRAAASAKPVSSPSARPRLPSNASSSRSPSGPSARTHAATLPRTVAVGVPSRSRSAISTLPLLIVTRKRRSGASPSASTTSSTAPSRPGGGSSSPGARRKIAPTLTSSPGRGAVHVQS